MSQTWRLVDLPGYGYARVARKDMAKFNQAVADYLEHRPNLRGVFVLIDSTIEPQKLDLEFVEWLARISSPIVLVFTKIDKVSATKVQTNIAAFTALLTGWCEQLPEIFTCSAVTRAGRNDLLGVIDRTLAADPNYSSKPPKTVTKKTQPPRMERRAAPWNRL
jgi:GTP-binding protein